MKTVFLGILHNEVFEIFLVATVLEIAMVAAVILSVDIQAMTPLIPKGRLLLNLFEGTTW